MPRKTAEKVDKSTDTAAKAATTSRRKQAPKPAAASENPARPDRVATAGDTITVEYVATLPNGRVFDKATPENPFVFTIGASQALPAFEAAIQGMRVGDTKTFSIHPLEAYGIWREDLVITVDRSSFPPGDQIEIGKRARATAGDGTEHLMKVTEITDAGIKLDGNHPLAGYTLTYNNLTLKAIS